MPPSDTAAGTVSEDRRGLSVRRLFPRWLAQAAADSLEPTIYRFILRYSLREQIYLVVVTMISFPFLYYSLDLPKLIVNQAIGGKHFPRDFLGFQLDQLPYLALLCTIFLILVLINGWFKLHLNIRKGRVGERMLRRLRYELFQRVLRFPMQHFDRTAAGQIIAMLTFELEPVGGFIGDAFALPISQAGTLLTIFFFMFVQNPVLGGAAVALYPLQAYLIPKMQRRIRALGRERIRKMRTLSDRIGESIAAQVEIRTNAAVPHQLADIAKRLGEIYELRFDIYNRKFFVKFLNNFLNQLTPFLFFLIGGYFVIEGQLSFGALVAVYAAYKELLSPWKELLDYYQNQQDVAIKYDQVIEQFQVPDLIDPHLLLDDAQPEAPVAGEIAFAGVSLVDSDGIRLLDGISLVLPLDAHAALIGGSNSGKNLVLQLLARLYMPTGGRIQFGGLDLSTLSFSASGRLIGYVGSTTHLLSASIRENLLLGLRYRPNSAAGGPNDAERAHAVEEARKSGNCELDIETDWVDYAQAGAADAAVLEVRIVEVLRLVDLEGDIYLFGLHGRLDPERHPDAPAGLLEARRRFEQRLDDLDLRRYVERFDVQRYNDNASIADNLLFGTPIGPTFEGDRLAEHAYVQKLLDQVGLTDDLVQVGERLAATMVELFGNIASEPGLAEEFGFIRTDELRDFERILARSRAGRERLTVADRIRLLGLALRLVAARDRLGLIDEGLRERVVAARRAFADKLPEELRNAVEFFDPEQYNAAARVEENILFGTIVHGESEARERVESAIGEVLDEIGLRDTVLAVGLDHQAGNGGSRLSPAQRQKVAIARAVLKRPALLALDEATAVLDPAVEDRVLAALQGGEFARRGILAALARPEAAQGFGRVLLMDQGRLANDGEYDAVIGGNRTPARRMAAE